MVLGRCMVKGKEHGLWGRRSRIEMFLERKIVL